MVVSCSGIGRLVVRGQLAWLLLWRSWRPRREEIAVRQARQADITETWNERTWAGIEYTRALSTSRDGVRFDARAGS